jgi:hypothetical protein
MVASRRSTEKTSGRPQITVKGWYERTFLPASPLGEQTGGENLGTVPAADVSKFFFSKEPTVFN